MSWFSNPSSWAMLASQLGHALLLAPLLTSAIIGCAGGAPDPSKPSAIESEARLSSSRAHAAASSTADVPANQATITRRHVAVGDVVRSTMVVTFAMRTKLRMPNGAIVDVDGTDEHTLDKTEECLAVVEKQCSRARVRVTRYEMQKLMNGLPKKEVKLTVGKLYVIERKGPALLVTLEDGSPAPAAERAEIEIAFTRFGRAPDLASSLPDEVKVGDSLDALARALAAEQASSDDPRDSPPQAVAKATVKSIREVGGHTIVSCAVVITIEGDRDKTGRLKLELRGSVDVRADIAQRISADLTGPFEITHADGGGTGVGTTSEKTTYSYEF